MEDIEIALIPAIRLRNRADPCLFRMIPLGMPCGLVEDALLTLTRKAGAARERLLQTSPEWEFDSEGIQRVWPLDEGDGMPWITREALMQERACDRFKMGIA